MDDSEDDTACPRQWVLHVDADAFFLQVESHRHNQVEAANTRPACVQQHQDIIALNHLAKSVGVKKHMKPAEARKLLRPHSGLVFHVFTEASGRVSYRPYRRKSRQLMDAIRSSLGQDMVVQVASIDEAFVQPKRPMNIVEVKALCVRLRESLQHATGIRVSVGVARNRLLAKLASSSAKPDGLCILSTPVAELALLDQTPTHKLPGLGSKKALLEQHGLSSMVSLRTVSSVDAATKLQLSEQQAQAFVQMASGHDPRGPVTENSPPSSYGAHTSLCATPRPEYGPDGEPTGKILTPIHANEHHRLRPFLQDMCSELLERIAEGADRWPKTLTVRIARNGAPAETSRSQAFPQAALLALSACSQDSIDKMIGDIPGTESLRAAAEKGLKELTAETPTAVISRVSIIATNFKDRQQPQTGQRSIASFLQRSPKKVAPKQRGLTAESEQQECISDTFDQPKRRKLAGQPTAEKVTDKSQSASAAVTWTFVRTHDTSASSSLDEAFDDL